MRQTRDGTKRVNLEGEEVTGEKMAMQQKEIERLAFLFLCGKRDREILMGKRKMSFSDFEKLTYMMDLLGMDAYNREIIEEYSEKFEEKIRQLEMLEQEIDDGADKELTVDTEKYEMWIEEFCSQVPDEMIRKQIEMQIKNR